MSERDTRRPMSEFERERTTRMLASVPHSLTEFARHLTAEELGHYPAVHARLRLARMAKADLELRREQRTFRGRVRRLRYSLGVALDERVFPVLAVVLLLPFTPLVGASGLLVRAVLTFRRWRSGSARGVSVARPPGSAWMTVLRFTCSPKTVERVYEPLYRDYLDEHTDDLAHGRVWRARWRRLCFYVNVMRSSVLVEVAELLKLITAPFRTV